MLAVSVFLSSDLSLKDVSTRIQLIIKGFGFWGPFAYIFFYSFRSLVLFPASVLTIIAGLLFGPWLGMLLTVIGENISANISFVVGRYIGSNLLNKLGAKIKMFQKIECKFQKNGFISVLAMRLMFLPFDLVGYSSGACNIRQWDFAMGTFIGTIPGLATFVLLGSAASDLKNLYFSGIAFLIGLLLSIFFKNKEHFQPTIS